MPTTLIYDYSREAAVLARMLQPGALPLGMAFNWEQPKDDDLAYLGEAEVEAYDSSVPIRDLTRAKWLQRRIRHVARREGIYEEWSDSIELNGAELGVEVEYPLSKMSRYEQARYRLRVLLVNSQGVLDGSAHEWALQVSRDQCADYWDRKGAKRGKWNADNCPDESDTLKLLLAAEIDLEPWSRAYGVDYYEELPETPPLTWVKESGVMQQLFGLSAEDISRGENIEDELYRAVAYALHALKEEQPESWHTELYLNHVLHLNLPTFAECQERLAERIATIPALLPYAGEIRAATDLETTNAVMKRLYEATPALGIWIIS